MLPLFFGEPHEQLLGVYHPPQGRAARDVGVVLCYPAGHECIPAMRAFRVLAHRLAREGFHALRFDYSCTGDSAGEGEEASLDRWRRDVHTAVDRISEFNGVQRVCLVGLRLGATLAAQAAAESRKAEALVLWEPVLQGKGYLEGLRGAHQAWLRKELRRRPAAGARVQEEEILGYPLPTGMEQELAGTDLFAIGAPLGKRILLLSAENDGETDRFAMHLTAMGAAPDRQPITEWPRWYEEHDSPHPLVPVGALGVIVEWLGGGAG